NTSRVVDLPGASPEREGRADKRLSTLSSLLRIGSSWTGRYRPTNCAMRLVFGAVDGSQKISGTIEYPEGGAITQIDGSVLDQSAMAADIDIVTLIPPDGMIDAAITFRETRELRK